MLSLFKRRGGAGTELTFKARTELFWAWFNQVAARFYETIEAKRCDSLHAEVSGKIDELLPGFAWVFGPGKGGVGHSFTLTGEGDLHRQLLALYWHQRAPEIPGWTFYPSRQADGIDGHRIQMGNQMFDPVQFWLTPDIDTEEEMVDLTVWHPLFGGMEEGARWTILFLFLDEVLGEYGTQQWIGKIQMKDTRLADAIALSELQPFVTKLGQDRNWKKLPPGEGAVGYRMHEPHDRFLRGDIIAGTTINDRLVNEYLAAKGDLSDPLAGTGADYVFISFDRKTLPAGEEVNARGRIEDALEQALTSQNLGRLVGGAMGTNHAYIDLMLFDGQRSLGTVVDVLKQRKLPGGFSINYFAKEKRGHRVVV
jgi:hypothetical protein